MFRTVPLYIIRSFSLYAQQLYMSYRFADSLRAGSGWNIRLTMEIEEINVFHKVPVPVILVAKFVHRHTSVPTHLSYDRLQSQVTGLCSEDRAMKNSESESKNFDSRKCLPFQFHESQCYNP
jgi:hypothetical protein